jgi:hypothetical protein
VGAVVKGFETTFGVDSLRLSAAPARAHA